MRTITTILAGAGGIAALAAAMPAVAQYYGYRNYNNYAYPMDTGFAQQQCTAAVQSRLSNRVSLGRIIGSVFGTTSSPQVLSVTQTVARANGTVRVRGLASSGRYAYNNYGPYGVGAYGALGYGYGRAADLSFRCDVAPNGAVYNVDINRR
jgi:hypothetical protein